MNPTLPDDIVLLPPVDYEIAPPPAAQSSRRFIALVALALCVTLGALYLVLHGAAAPASPAATPKPEQAMPHSSAPEIQAMVDRLAARLQNEPDNGAGWQMLAKSYAALGRFADAAAAYGKATALLPPDAGLLADRADVLAMTQSGDFRGEPARLIQQALALDPRHPKALALAGTEAFRRKADGEALAYWNRALALVPADSALAVSVRGGIAELASRRDGVARNR